VLPAPAEVLIIEDFLELNAEGNRAVDIPPQRRVQHGVPLEPLQAAGRDTGHLRQLVLVDTLADAHLGEARANDRLQLLARGDRLTLTRRPEGAAFGRDRI
jgi:hypothetical protein